MIEKLVSELPEVYQPIFGHSELSEQVSRSCEDRLKSIIQVYDSLQNSLGRPLNVLDLGCAQGYFSLNLAKHGATVCGVDFLDKNIAVCRALAKENPDLNVDFENCLIEDIAYRIKNDQYDFVLGLSVFHHIVHQKGIKVVQDLLEHLANKCGCLIIEMALHEEPLYWASAQPKDPREMIEAIAFIHEVARYETHLAPIARPLFIASNRYWILGDRSAKFDEWTFESHALADGTHQRSRRYYFNNDSVLKMYRLDHPRGDFNQAEILRESEFLGNIPLNFSAPKLRFSGKSSRDIWISVEKLPGNLLLDLIREEVDFDSHAVLLSVLNQLVALEAAGLYHDDIRAWNILVDEDKVFLIDHGSISRIKRDCVWPENIFLAFLIFVKEIVSGVTDNSQGLRNISMSPYGLPSIYGKWAALLWKCPLDNWSFKLMLEVLKEISSDDSDEYQYMPVDAWMNAIEAVIQIQKKQWELASKDAQLNKAALEKFQETDAKEIDELKSFLKGWENKQENILAEISELKVKSDFFLRDSLRNLENSLTEKVIQAQSLEGRLFSTFEQFRNTEGKISTLEMQSVELRSRLASEEVHARVQEAQVLQLSTNLNYWWSQARDLEMHLHAIQHSWSWRVTKPIRFAADLLNSPVESFRRGAKAIVDRFIQILQFPLSFFIAYVLRKPRLSYRINQWILRFPKLHQKLRDVRNREDSASGHALLNSDLDDSIEKAEREVENLAPHAKKIYAEMSAAIEKKNRNI